MSEGRGRGVIGVPCLRPVRDHNARAQFADHFDDDGARILGIGKRSIRETGAVSFTQAQDAAGFRCFLRARFARAGTAHLSCSEIEDANALLLPRVFGEETTTQKFRIVGVSDDGKQVEAHS